MIERDILETEFRELLGMLYFGSADKEEVMTQIGWVQEALTTLKNAVGRQIEKELR